MANPVPVLAPAMALPVILMPRVVEAPLPCDTEKSAVGVLVPMPSRLLVASQNRFVLF